MNGMVVLEELQYSAGHALRERMARTSPEGTESLE